MKAGPKLDTTVGGVPPQIGASDGTSGGGLPPQGGASEGGDFLALELDGDTEEPIAQTARKLVNKELNRSCIHTSKDTFDNDVVSRVLPTQKAIFLVDAVTSKQKVLNSLVEHCAALVARIGLARYVIACPVGSRVDLLSGVLYAFQKHFPKGHPIHRTVHSRRIAEPTHYPELYRHPLRVRGRVCTRYGANQHSQGHGVRGPPPTMHSSQLQASPTGCQRTARGACS